MARRQRAGGTGCVHPLPDYHHRRLCSSNSSERGIQQELEQPFRKIRVFPNIESLERLVSDVLVEIDDKWVAAEKEYIKWELQDD